MAACLSQQTTQLNTFNKYLSKWYAIEMSMGTHIVCGNKPGHLSWRGQLSINEALDFAFRPTIVYIHYGNHIPLKWIQKSETGVKANSSGECSGDYLTFRGWNSYFTQCWKPLPLTFIEVRTRQLPTKCAV